MSIDPNAENYVNDAGVEAAWAAQAMAHAEVYHKLLASVVDPAKLTLTAYAPPRPLTSRAPSELFPHGRSGQYIAFEVLWCLFQDGRIAVRP